MLWTTGLTHAEGLTAQFTIGQRFVYTNEDGLVNDPDEGLVSRTDLGFAIASETRNQRLAFNFNTGLNANLTNSDIVSSDRTRLQDPVARLTYDCLLYTSPSPRDRTRSRMPSSA